MNLLPPDPRGGTGIGKLKVGAAHSALEQEADRISNSAMRLLSQGGRAAQLGANIGQENGNLLQRDAASAATESTGPEPVSMALEQTLSQQRTRGTRLEWGARHSMESVFGGSFDKVRIHDDRVSDQMNQSLDSHAFTHGNHVFFARGAYKPQTRGGQALLAHELTHVRQQSKNLQLARIATRITAHGLFKKVGNTSTAINNYINRYNRNDDAGKDAVDDYITTQSSILDQIENLIASKQWPTGNNSKQNDTVRILKEVTRERTYLGSLRSAPQTFDRPQVNPFRQALTGTDFHTNYIPSRGDVLYGLHGSRLKYTDNFYVQQDGANGVFMIMDSYNNYFGIGEGEAVRGRQGQTHAYMQRQFNQFEQGDTDYRGLKYRGAATYHEQIKHSRFDPKKVYDLAEADMEKDAPLNRPIQQKRQYRAIRRACKFGLAMIANMEPFKSQGAKVHFVLDGTDIQKLAAKEKRSGPKDAGYLPITSSELRYVFRYWNQLQGIVIFYVDGHEVPAPWLQDWTHQDAYGKDVSSAKSTWDKYGTQLQTKYALTPQKKMY